MPFAVAAVAVGGAVAADVGVNIYDSIKAGKVASSQANMASTVFGEQQQYAQQLAQLIQDPSSVSKLPGYQFQMDQGTQAVARQMASSGFVGSGNEAIALTQYGQGLAQSFYGQQANLLASLSGLQVATSPATYGQTALKGYETQSNLFGNAMQDLSSFAGWAQGTYGSRGGTPASAAGGWSGYGMGAPPV